jgi:hypothetical protein
MGVVEVGARVHVVWVNRHVNAYWTVWGCRVEMLMIAIRPKRVVLRSKDSVHTE